MSDHDTDRALEQAHERLATLERRLQVEEALDRIRARALAMRRSDELASVASVLLREQRALGIDAWRSGVGITRADESAADVWTATSSPEGDDALQLTFHIPLHGHPTVDGLYDAWKRQTDFYAYDLSGEALEEYAQFMADHQAGPLAGEHDEPTVGFSRMAFHFFPFPHGAVSAVAPEPLPDEALPVMRRITDAFAFAYTRYLDLKQAEEQARKAQIEAALERVRARSMGMRHSDELSEVASVVFEQFEGLGLNPVYAGVAIIEDEAGYADLWLTAFRGGVNPVRIQLPLTGHPQVEKNMVAWRRSDPFLSWVVEGKEAVQAQAEAYAAFTGDPHFLHASPAERQEHLEACHTYGTLSIVSFETISAETRAILRRFARVFEQTYTRFLDLKKAEEQAREAQIEAALERVRARALAMRHSDELSEAAELLYQEFLKLGVESFSCGYLVNDDEKGEWKIWLTNPNEKFFKEFWTAPYEADHNLKSRYESWKRQEAFHCAVLEGEENRAHHIVISRYAPWKAEILDSLPPRLVFNSAHFSLGHLLVISPDRLASEVEQALVRFANVFDLAYRRFLDLQQAEAQAREAQIEAALERVRSRAMAMHRSDELAEVIAVVFAQLQSLGFGVDTCSIEIIQEETQDMQIWYSSVHQPLFAQSTLLPASFWTLNHPFVARRLEAMEQEETFYTEVYSHEEKDSLLQWLFEHSDFKYLPEERKAYVLECPGYARSNALTKHGLLNTQNYEGEPYSAEEDAILQRFARVFEQTYTRFLDLKQAEEQAHEAKIEAALERVRSRSMAMYQSDELREVVAVLLEQIQPLGFESFGCTIIICDEATGGMDNWYSSDMLAILPESYHVPYLDHPVRDTLWNAWKNRAPYTAFESTGDLKRSWDRVCFEETDFKKVPEAIKAEIRAQKSVFGSLVSMRYGLLATWSYLEPLPDDKAAILHRFTRVFEQTYTRFLDLKQAEEQAREAQIEAALERVRAKSLAMHRSDELAEVSVVLFEQLDALGLSFDLTCVCIMDEHSDTVTIWPTDLEGGLVSRSFAFPLKEDPMGEKMYRAWQQRAPEARKGHVTVTEYTGRDLQELFEWFSILPNDQDDATIQHFRETPESMIAHDALFSHGWLSILSIKPFDAAELDISKRFAGVFEQAYVRFLDLKQAEEQAREAQIEAALERVRAKAMAMHHSNELLDVVAVIFKEMQHLGFETSLCSIAIIDAETGDSVWWQSDETHSVLPQSYRVPHLDHPWWKRLVETWRQGVPFFSLELAGETKRSLDAIFFTETDYKDLPEESKAMMMGAERSMQSYASMNHGLLEMMTEEPLSDGQIDILQRFANVIDLTYTRFDDLQQAEARAREAVRQASLDRVRAEIASMRTAADLQRITPLVWRELTTLGVPFFRCGVIIADEASGEVEMFLSNNYGEQLAALRLPFESHPLIQNAVATWRNRQVFTDQWEQERLVAWVDFLMDRGQVATSEEYMDRDGPPPSLAIHLVPFAQGLLYVGSAEPLADDQVDLVQALADAFAVAYARYADFKQLEAAKADVEAALDHLKMTQNQLIQSEKMASLGALTAGIAHEIKNPLNFVNNFSQLSVELAEELRQEIETHRDKTLAEVAADLAEILDDLALNAEKIHEHGARADGIVKSMMQHARGGEGERRATDVNALVEEYVNLAYHGMRAATPDFNVTLECDYDEAAGEAELVPQEIGRVFINLFNNAFFAVYEEARAGDEAYTPVVTVATHRTEDAVTIRVQDNGPGIPEAVREKIFEPFFTTKPTGQGTGLGLSISYDIVTQGHGGTLVVEGAEGGGVVFTITLPA